MNTYDAPGPRLRRRGSARPETWPRPEQGAAPYYLTFKKGIGAPA